MVDLVTVDVAKSHIRIDSDDDDIWLAVMIPAISAAVLSWLKEDWRAYVPSGEIDDNGNPVPLVDTNDELVVNPIVSAAVLIEIAKQYSDREGDTTASVPVNWGHGYVLGAGATSLLSSLRKSTAV